MILALLILAAGNITMGGEAITCSGTWAPSINEQALVRYFGKANVTRGMVYLAEGNEEPGTIVFPNDEKKRLEIVWKNKHRNPSWIRIPAGSQWRTFAGVRTGMTLQDLESLNARPFAFSGFDWDYGGLVTNWRGGRLGNTGSPCTLSIQLDRNVPERLTKRQEQALDATSGDRELLSSSQNVRMFQTFVGEIIVSYP